MGRTANGSTGPNLLLWRMALSRTADWKFYQHPHGGWSWYALGCGARGSDSYFAGIVEALADAMQNGYEPGISRITSITMCRRSRTR